MNTTMNNTICLQCPFFKEVLARGEEAKDQSGRCDNDGEETMV